MAHRRRTSLAVTVYAASLAATGWCVFVTDWYCGTTPYFPPDVAEPLGWTMGRPVPWAAAYQDVPDGPYVWSGSNPVVPLALVLLGLGSAAAVVGRLGRSRAYPPGRRERLGRCAIIAGLAGLVVAAVDLDTGWGGAWCGRPSARLDRLFDRVWPSEVAGFVQYPGHRPESYRLRNRPEYRWFEQRSNDLRRQWVLDRYVPITPGNPACYVYPNRPLLAGLTAWAMVCFGGAALVWWKPWRPAAATTGPPA